MVKADGLAAGKGVTVAETAAEADGALRAALVDRVFGDAGSVVLVEAFVSGREVSVLGITDGTRVFALPPAQDFKRVGEGDTGPNTGGMGAYSPVPFIDDFLQVRIVEEILDRGVAAMAEVGIGFRGVLYAGLMLTEKGPTVLEFNARFGDPETEAVLPLLDFDLAELLLAAAEGDLRGHFPSWKENACVTVVVASGGYPGDYETGFPIEGLDEAAAQRSIVEVVAEQKNIFPGRARRTGSREPW